MSIGNRFVAAVLRSPFHRALSGSTALIRYTGRRTGGTFTTPVQYARNGDSVLILAGDPHDKVWWRNFRIESWIEVLMHGRWVTMSAAAVVGAEEPDVIAPLLDTYVARFPHAARTAGGDRADLVHGSVIVRCSPA